MNILKTSLPNESLSHLDQEEIYNGNMRGFKITENGICISSEEYEIKTAYHIFLDRTEIKKIVVAYKRTIESSLSDMLERIMPDKDVTARFAILWNCSAFPLEGIEKSGLEIYERQIKEVLKAKPSDPIGWAQDEMLAMAERMAPETP